MQQNYNLLYPSRQKTVFGAQRQRKLFFSQKVWYCWWHWRRRKCVYTVVLWQLNKCIPTFQISRLAVCCLYKYIYVSCFVFILGKYKDYRAILRNFFTKYVFKLKLSVPFHQLLSLWNILWALRKMEDYVIN